MKRRAILITGDAALDEGADVMDRFLRSALGGAWRGEEVIRLVNPNRADVVSAIADAKSCDFALIYFVGQGETRKSDRPWTETHIQLQSGEMVTERDLNPGNPRCSLILDCSGHFSPANCPTLHPTSAPTSPAGNDHDWSRSAYDEAVGAAESGVVKMFATVNGEESRPGRTFAHHLIATATAWATKDQGLLTNDEAFARALLTFTHETPSGKAEYRGGRRLRDFPFAVCR